MSNDQVISSLVEARLTTADLRKIFNLGRNTFYRLQAIGRFDRFEIKPRVSQRRRFFSAKKVQAYLDGEK